MRRVLTTVPPRCERVSLDDKSVGSLKSPGIAHPTKSDFHFTVTGRDAIFDDVRIWSAGPANAK